MNKSVLFIINGFGMGNATRCDSLMDILAEEYSIEVITSDKAYEYYKDNKKISHLYKQADLNLKNKIQFGSFKYYVQYVPHFFKRLFHNYKIQKNIQKSKKYAAVFYDSDYGFILSALTRTSKIRVGVNNSFEILSFLYNNPDCFKLNLIPSLIVELLDFCTHYLFCNYIICPCLNFDFKNKNPLITLNKVFLSAPLIRKKIITSAKQSSTRDQILVMSSSSNIETSLNLLKKGPLTGYTFLTEKFEIDNSDILASSSLIVCNSGQSSITECLYLNKKAIIDPLPRHSEQYVNSLIAKNKGLHILNFDEATFQINTVLNSDTNIDYNFNYSEAVKIMKLQIKLIEEDIHEHMR